MNNCSRRFLALNCVLNGHSLLEAYDGDKEKACSGLALKEDQLEDLLRRYEEAFAKPVITGLYDANIVTLINFFRCSEFAFVCFPGMRPIFFKDFAESDRQGQISAEARNVVLQNVIRDIAPVDDEKEIRISDGVFYSTEQDTASLMAKIKGAYFTFRSGPKTKMGYNEALLADRSKLTMQGYRDMTANTCVRMLSEILLQNLNPTVYRDTCLLIPDLLPVYNITGTLLSLPINEVSDNNVRWVVDIKGTEKAKSVLVDFATLRSLIVSDTRDLCNIAYSADASKNGFVVV